MKNINYVSHYSSHIQLFAPYLSIEDIEKVMAQESAVTNLVNAKYGVGSKLEGPVFEKARERFHRKRVQELRSRTKVAADDIEMILYFKDLTDELIGRYGLPRRKHRTPGKGMTKELCREWFAEKINAITQFGYEKTLHILTVRDDVQIEVMVQYGFIPLLSDEMQKSFEQDMLQCLLYSVVEETGFEESEVGMTFVFENLLTKLCGAPQKR